MGFDNECIVNLQSLAGEYFCPVCRLLVYPNEALQSLCTHLYCKPCLTYVVSTTRACPYDGYLVTEADSKPLMESNKTVAETIGKIPVHCLYHRSGCTWQGTLSECTSHCSGCAFGNSPVVCNRCGIQIVHRQVQEHAQSCPGVQGPVQQAAVTQDPSATSAVASTDQKQTAATVGAIASQAQNSQAAVTTTTPGQVSNQLPIPSSQSQPVQTGVQPTAEQWYQQQQYQQYYQQYTGQDPYQQQYQHYNPYQQSVVPQYQQAYGQPQPQFQSQPQAQPQSQGQPQAQHQAQPQAQHQAQPQLQPQPQAQGLSQQLPQVPASVVPSSQPQMPVPQQQQQQQLQPAVQPHSQIQPPSHLPGHTKALPQSQSQSQPQPYPYPQVAHAVQPQPQQHMQMPPYQQPHPQMQHSQPQMQHSQPQTQQPVQKHPITQPQPNAQSQLPPYLPPPPNIQPQVQNAPSHAVTGYHSYPQPLQSMQPGAPQNAMQMHAQSGSLPQAQHPVPMQNQFSQQIPVMHPHQSPATFPNQQQQALLPSPVQGQSTPPLQQQPVHNPNQQPGQINQRPTLHPVQPILPQQPFPQHQMPRPSHLRPQGPAHSFPRHVFPPSQGNPALLSSTHHSKPQNTGGRPLLPNHAAQIQQFPQSANNIPVRPGQTGVGHWHENQKLLVGTNNQVQLSSDLQSRVPEQIGSQGDVAEQQTDSASGKHGKTLKDLKVPGSANDLKSEKVETDIKPTEVGNKKNGEEDPNSVKTSGPNANALENGDSVSKSVGKGEVAESTRETSSGNQSVDTRTVVQNNSNEHSALRGNDIQDGPLLKTEAKKVSESETDKLRNDDMHTSRPLGANNAALAAPSQTHGGQGPGLDEYRSMQSGSFAQPISSGHSSTLARNHGPGHGPHLGQPLNSAESFQPTMFKQPQGSDIHFGTPGQSFPPQSLGPPGPHNQGQEPPFHAGASNLSRIGRPQFGAPPPGDMHGGMATNMPPHGPEGFGLQHEGFNSFQVPGHQNFDRREFEDDLKKFPRPPLDAEPISKFGNYSLGPHEAGKRPAGFHDDALKKSGTALRPGYLLGAGPGYGRHRVDGMAPRSPGSEYAEMAPRRLGPLSGGLVSRAEIDDFDGRAARRFGESAGMSFHDNRFPRPPGQLHRDEFEGFGNFRMGEHPRSGDFIGQDEFSGYFQRREHFGPHNFPRHFPPGEPIGFGSHPGHMRAIELGGSRSFESFSKGNRPGHPQLGEPGFRSSFSLPGFPNDAGFVPGDIRSYDNLRRRKAASMGWCRICSVDCETVEGLDLHSQTREHQKMAMDMVKRIKQNVKKQKLTPGEHSSVEDGNKSRNAGFEGRVHKH